MPERSRQLILLLIVSAIGARAGFAQELTPRAYWPTPKGTNVAVVSFQGSSGDIVTDPTLPIEGAETSFDFSQFTYQRTLGLFGRTTNLQVNLPYARGYAEGFVEGELRTRNVSDVADARLRLSVNLSGAPSMDAAGFQALRADPPPIIGLSFLLQVPNGGYENDKFINAGSNRWALKPAIGGIIPMAPSWLFEFEFGAWWFGDNDEYVGAVREQDTIMTAEIHLVKRIRQGFWVSADLNYYAGGRTTIDGVERRDRQGNSRLGATLTFPFKGRNAFRFSYGTAIVTRIGGDYDNWTFSYLYAW